MSSFWSCTESHSLCSSGGLRINTAALSLRAMKFLRAIKKKKKKKREGKKPNNNTAIPLSRLLALPCNLLSRGTYNHWENIKFL